MKHFDAQLRICGDELKAAHETQLLIDPSWNEGRTPGWTLSELREVYLADALKKLGTRWSSQVRSLLDDNLLAQLDTRHVRDLELIHLQPVIKQGQTANVAISRLYRIAQNFKLMLRWGAENHSGETGLDPRNDWWRLLKVEYSSNEGTNEPSLRDLARTILVAEELAEHPDDPVEPGVVGALWATVLLCQRISQVVAMRTDRFLTDNREDEFEFDQPGDGEREFIRNPLGSDWRIYTWTVHEMKGPLPHALPIPPEALAIIRRYVKDDCPTYLFPRGDGDHPCYPTAVNRLFYRMAGRPAKGGYERKPDRPGKTGPKPKPPPVLFDYMTAHGIKWWTPHDVRRSLTERLKARKLGAAASAIEAHRSRIDDASRRREALLPVTRLHYAPGQDIELKAEGLNRWVRLVLAAYESERKTYVRGKAEVVTIGSTEPSCRA